MSPGLVFETEFFVQKRAPELFRDWLVRDQCEPETITISSVNDCYQPIEEKLRLTRRCLEVALEARQSTALITKNEQSARDLDILQELARLQIVSVAINVNATVR